MITTTTFVRLCEAMILTAAVLASWSVLYPQHWVEWVCALVATGICGYLWAALLWSCLQ